MTTRVQYDFSRPATLGHIIDAVGTFSGVAERGRASATVGAANAATRIAAAALGDWANGLTYRVDPTYLAGTYDRVEVDPAGVISIKPRLNATALQVVTALNAQAHIKADTFPPDGRMADLYAAVRAGKGLFYGADLAGGTGADAAAIGSATLAGGLAPSVSGGNEYIFESNANAGLFVFDNDEPLVLVQFMAVLSGSVAWTLKLSELTSARADQSVNVAIDGATGTTALVINKPVIIPRGWGLSFAAAAQGSAYAIVRRAYP